MDPISDIFSSMHITAFGQHRLEATAPWGLIQQKQADERVPLSDKRIPPFDVAHFAMLSRGNCWLSVEGVPAPIPLAGGDCFLLSRNTSIVMRDNPRTRPRSTFGEVASTANGNVALYGGGGAPTTIVCGSFSFDRASFRPISQLLPNFILIKSDQASTIAPPQHAAGLGVRDGTAGAGICSRRDSACRGAVHPDSSGAYRFGA